MNTALFYFYKVPPSLVSIVLALLVIGLAAGQWRWSRLIDFALAASYSVRPGIGTLIFVGVLYGVRWTPTLSREVGLLIGAANARGWTLALIVFLLPSLATYRTASSYKPAATGATEVLPPAIGASLPPPAEPPALPPLRAPLSAGEWLREVNDEPTAPHLAVIGPVRLGKTTFALAALGRRRGQFVVTTPKAAETDPWDGFPATRLRIDLAARKIDWSPIASAIGQVHYEMLRRNAENRIASSDWLTLVVDELATTFANAPETRKHLIDLWLMGPSSRVRVIAINPDANVRAWGIEGRRDVLDSLLFAKVQTAAREWSIGRLDPNGRLIDPIALDTGGLVALAEDAHIAGRVWAGLSPWVAPLEGGTAPAGPAQTQTPDQTNRPTATDEELIALLKDGHTREQIGQILDAQGKGLDNNRLAELRSKLGLSRPRRAKATV